MILQPHHGKQLQKKGFTTKKYAEGEHKKDLSTQLHVQLNMKMQR